MMGAVIDIGVAARSQRVSSTSARVRGRPLSICIVTANLPPVYSGAGLQALALGRMFHQLGHSVVFLSRRHGTLPRQESIDGLDVFRVDYREEANPGLITIGSQLVSLVVELHRLRRRFDVALFFNPEGGFYHSWLLIPLLRAFGKKTATRMTLISSSDPASMRRRRLGWLRVLPYRLHNKVISISTALSLSFREVFGNDPRLVYIPNGVDLRRFHPLPNPERLRLRTELGLSPTLRYCTFVGRISYRKGIDILIEAWRRVALRHSEARLMLVGPEVDDLRPSIHNEFVAQIRGTIRRYELSSSILWVGRTDAVERYLQASDAFLFCSRREGCPNALLEAMACRLPIVSTRIPSITEDLMANGTHGLITSPDPVDFAEAVVRVLSNEALATTMAREAFDRVTREFSIESTAGRYLRTLEAM